MPRSCDHGIEAEAGRVREVRLLRVAVIRHLDPDNVDWPRPALFGDPAGFNHVRWNAYVLREVVA